MENTGSSHSGRSSRSRKERSALPPSRGHRQSKTGKTTEAASAWKEKKRTTERTKVAAHPDAEVKVKTTVVDIDSVRDEEVKDEHVGLLEAAEQDGKRELGLRRYFSHLCSTVSEGESGSLQV